MANEQICVADKWKKRHHTRLGVLQSVISPWNRKGEEKKRSYYNTVYSYLVTHPSTNPTEQGLTLFSGQKMLLSLWYSDSTLNAFLKISKMRIGNKKRKKTVILAGKIENEKNRGI